MINLDWMWSVLPKPEKDRGTAKKREYEDYEEEYYSHFVDRPSAA